MGSEHSAAGRPRSKTLAALALAVLGLHFLLLQSAAQWSAPASERAQALSFQTRMLEASRPAGLTTPATAPVASAKPVQAAPASPVGTSAQAPGLTAITAGPPADNTANTPSLPTAETASPPDPPASAPVMAAAVPPPAELASASQASGTRPETNSSLPAVANTAATASATTTATAPTASYPAEPATPGTTAASPPAASARIAPNNPPASVRLKYRVDANRFPFSLSSELSWQQDGQNYQARLEFSALGQSRVQTSRGLITPGGLAPLRFSDKYRTEVAAHFNREQGKITFSANTPDIPLQPGAQDRLSVLIQLAALLAGERAAYPVGSTIAIQTIGPRDADSWQFNVEAEEMLPLPGGEQNTLKLLRKPRKEFDQRVELWLAPALGYLPVRVRITEANGDALDQKWLASEALR